MGLWDDVFLSNAVSKLSIEFDSNVAIHGLDIHLGFPGVLEPVPASVGDTAATGTGSLSSGSLWSRQDPRRALFLWGAATRVLPGNPVTSVFKSFPL